MPYASERQQRAYYATKGWKEPVRRGKKLKKKKNPPQPTKRRPSRRGS